MPLDDTWYTEIYANDGDSINFVRNDTSGSQPIYSLIAQDRSHGAPELDVRFRPQSVRYLKLRSTGERPFQMGDMEIFGLGVTPFAHYISRVIDLGQPAIGFNWIPAVWLSSSTGKESAKPNEFSLREVTAA